MSIKEDLLSEINDDYRCDLFQEFASARAETSDRLKKKYNLTPVDYYLVELEDGYFLYDKKKVIEILKKWNSADNTHCGEKVQETYPIPFKDFLE